MYLCNSKSGMIRLYFNTLRHELVIDKVTGNPEEPETKEFICSIVVEELWCLLKEYLISIKPNKSNRYLFGLGRRRAEAFEARGTDYYNNTKKYDKGIAND